MHKVLRIGVLVFMLAACGPTVDDEFAAGASTASRAIANEIDNRRPPILTPLNEHQTKQRPHGNPVILASYEANDENGARLQYLHLFELERSGIRWILRGADPRDVPANAPPIEYFRSGIPDYLAVYGRVGDPAVHQVGVILQDGTRELVSVENGTYLLVNSLPIDVERVEALDAQGMVLHVIEPE